MMNNLLDLTWRNPIFMLVVIVTIWYIPGIVARRIAEKRDKASKEEAQAKAISRLYPKQD